MKHYAGQDHPSDITFDVVLFTFVRIILCIKTNTPPQYPKKMVIDHGPMESNTRTVRT